MAFTEAFPIVHTDDLRRLVQFYTEVMGLQVRYRYPADGDPEFVTVTVGPTEIGLGEYRGLEGSLGPVTRGGRPFQMCMYTDDLDGDLARLRAAGTPVLQEPLVQPWHERMCYVADPDANLIMLVQRLD
jgi:lactoylglutathione lyase